MYATAGPPDTAGQPEPKQAAPQASSKPSAGSQSGNSEHPKLTQQPAKVNVSEVISYGKHDVEKVAHILLSAQAQNAVPHCSH